MGLTVPCLLVIYRTTRKKMDAITHADRTQLINPDDDKELDSKHVGQDSNTILSN